MFTDEAPGDPRAAERMLILSYCRPDRRAGAAALLALDATLGGLVRRVREPMIGQMRLTWWSEAIEALDEGRRFAEPVLTAIADTVLPVGVAGADLAAMVDGWEPLLDPELPPDTLVDAVAQSRGGVLFEALARVLDVHDARVPAAGAGWALADVARHLSDPHQAAIVAAAAQDRLAAAMRGRWPRAARMLGALALAARLDLADVAPGAPRRVARIAWHRLGGS